MTNRNGPLSNLTFLKSLKKSRSQLNQHLLDARAKDGRWVGRLSSSALSTATAVIALAITDQEKHTARITAGLEWLVRNQNQDGGWGDTVISKSNISTTVLCWAAFFRNPGPFAVAIQLAKKWLDKHAGSIKAKDLSAAIMARYGKDRTFSIPILSACAMTGRLGELPEAWRWIQPLPFELAAIPHRLFKWVQMPVVSYALPALIALGQVRHFQCPTRNPVTAVLRHLARDRTLKVLAGLQPESGGFLEATPLTSFVVMSLATLDLRDHPVVGKGIDFLVNSVREDGSWPIDTDLANWVTSLSINALPAVEDSDKALSEAERQRLCHWLLSQQYQEEHPFTHAEPGGWAWTNFSGGVPDADDTPGALLALRKLDVINDEVIRAAENGVRWLLNLQNRDGGIPTFCRGWGHLPFDQSSPDLTAHTLRAFMAWQPFLSSSTQWKVKHATLRALRCLLKKQREDGAWIPLWFGNQHADKDENPIYGTSRVLLAFALLLQDHEILRQPIQKAVHWILQIQNADGGWGGDINTPSTIEETALTLEALSAAHARIQDDKLDRAIKSGAEWLIDETTKHKVLPASPIGFYFANLWYFEDLYPLIFAAGALNRVPC